MPETQQKRFTLSEISYAFRQKYTRKISRAEYIAPRSSYKNLKSLQSKIYEMSNRLKSPLLLIRFFALYPTLLHLFRRGNAHQSQTIGDDTHHSPHQRKPRRCQLLIIGLNKAQAYILIAAVPMRMESRRQIIKIKS